MSEVKEIKKESSGLSAWKIFWLRNFFFIVLFLIFSVFLFGFVFLLKPKYDEIGMKVVFFQEQGEKRLNEAADLYDNLREYVEFYDNIPNITLDRVDDFLPLDDGQGNIFILLEKIIKDEDLDLLSLKFDLQAEEQSASSRRRAQAPVATTDSFPEEIKKLSLIVELGEVDYWKLKSLLYSLESSLKIFDIDTIDFSPKGRSARLGVSVYYLEDNFFN